VPVGVTDDGVVLSVRPLERAFPSDRGGSLLLVDVVVAVECRRGRGRGGRASLVSVWLSSS
jgi:hypothetical protein